LRGNAARVIVSGWGADFNCASGREGIVMTAMQRLRALATRPPVLGMTLVFAVGFLCRPGAATAADPPEPKRVGSLTTRGPCFQLAFSADGRSLAVKDGGTVLLWEVASQRVRGSLDGGTFALCGDGRTLAFRDGLTLRRGDFVTGETADLTVHSYGLYAVAFSPDGKLVASGGGVVKVVDAATGKDVQRLIARHGVWHLAFSPDGKTLTAVDHKLSEEPSSPMAGAVRRWDVASWKELEPLAGKEGQPPRNLVYSPDGKAVAAQDTSDRVWVWDAASGRSQTPWGPLQERSFIEGFSPDGRVLVGTGGGGIVGGADWGPGLIKFWDTASGKELLRMEFSRHQVDVALSPDGCLLAGAGGDDVSLWDVSAWTGGKPPPRPLPRPPVNPKAPQPRKPSADDLERLWSDLAGDDAVKAYRAVWALAESPAEAVPFLGKHLEPAAAPAARRVDQLIAALDSDAFADRQAALEELAGLGDRAAAALRQELKRPRSPEVRRLVERLLDKVDGALSAGPLREVRAVEALEYAGTPEARRLLGTLAEGTPAARMTREARKALDRLGDAP
jgi:hypothetical protein